MHPCFVRGNKAMCASMSRHHLPSPEMYNRVLLEGASSTGGAGPQQPQTVNQYILDNKPDQLRIDRHDRVQPLSSRKEYSSQQDQAQCDDDKKTPLHQTTKESEKATIQVPLAKHINKMMAVQTRALFAPTDGTSEDAERFEGKALSKDQDEDWSLLSDCLQQVINPSTFTSTGPLGLHNEEDAIDFPLDALAPGMEEPASPEAIETLFAEFNS